MRKCLRGVVISVALACSLGAADIVKQSEPSVILDVCGDLVPDWLYKLLGCDKGATGGGGSGAGAH